MDNLFPYGVSILLLLNTSEAAACVPSADLRCQQPYLSLQISAILFLQEQCNYLNAVTGHFTCGGTQGHFLDPTRDWITQQHCNCCSREPGKGASLCDFSLSHDLPFIAFRKICNSEKIRNDAAIFCLAS